MATNYADNLDASKKIEELFEKNAAAGTTAEQQTAALNQATDQAYRERQLQGQQAQNQFAQNTMANQMSAIDAIRRSNASAIASGANAGLSAANQLSAILGLQEDTVGEATQLANDSLAAASERNTQMAQNAVTGQQQANQINTANLDRDLGFASLFPQLGAADAERIKAEATVRAAELGLDASKYTADTQAMISKLQIDRDWDKTLLASSLEAWDLLQKEKDGVIAAQRKIINDKNAPADKKAAAQTAIRNVELEQLYLRGYLTSGDRAYMDLYEQITGAKAAKENG